MATQEPVVSQGLPCTPSTYVKSEPSGANGYDSNSYPPEGHYGNHHHYLYAGQYQQAETPPHSHHPYQQQQVHHPYPHHHQGTEELNHQTGGNNHQQHHYAHTGQYGQQHLLSVDSNVHLQPHQLPQHHQHHQVQHYSHMMPGPGNHVGGYKQEHREDPYSFVDEDMMQRGSSGPTHGATDAFHPALRMNNTNQTPKKRGRKKKIDSEGDMSTKIDDVQQGLNTIDMMLPIVDADGLPITKKVDQFNKQQRRRHDRFNGMSEDEVRSRTLPDHLTTNLDVVIIGINPGLFAAYKGHHYAGPGNHFWKCLFLAGLVPEPMTADDDFKLLHFGIGFTNMVARPTKGSADLTRKEIREGGRILLEKLQQYRPKIAVFNGKGIYEVFSGKKDFAFGKQPECIDGTNTFIWVMPSSSARCAQLPRAMDKVPFYSGLKKFRDYLNGLIPEIDDSEVIFNDPKIRAADDGSEISEHLKDSLSSEDLSSSSDPTLLGHGGNGEEFSATMMPGIRTGGVGGSMDPLDPGQIPVKKKRGRPKKIRPADGCPPIAKPPVAPKLAVASQHEMLFSDGPPKKKRGRPKKVRNEQMAAPNSVLDMNGSLGSNSSHGTNHSGENGVGSISSASPAPSYAGHVLGQQQQQLHHHQHHHQHHSNMEYYYGRSPGGGGGPLSGLCNDGPPQLQHPHQHHQHQPSHFSPGQPNVNSSPPRLPNSETLPGISGASSEAQGPSRDSQANGGSASQIPESPSSENREATVDGANQFPPAANQQSPETTPQPLNYPPALAPPPSGNPYQPVNNQDVASKSLSGLESLVHQIPANAVASEAERQQQQLHHQHALQQHQAAVSGSFGHYATSQPSYSYASASYGHYTPQYTNSPVGGPGFPPHPYHGQGHPQELSFPGSGPPASTYSMAPMGPSGAASAADHNGSTLSGFHVYPGYGTGQYPPPAGPPGFPSYSSASGFPGHSSYAYPVSSTSNGGTDSIYSYTQVGYPNGNHQSPPKAESSYGGY